MDENKAILETMLNLFVNINNSFNNELKNYPEGSLHHCIRNGRDNYFRAEIQNGKLVRHGITRDRYQIHQFARKRYLEEAAKILTGNIQVLNRAISELETMNGDDILRRMPAAYRRLPENLFLTRPTDTGADDGHSDGIYTNKGRKNTGYHQIVSGIYVPESLREAAIQGTLTASQREQIREIQREWANQDYPRNTKNLEHKRIITTRGLRVRSMAESAISEALYEHDIPFRHDQLIRIGSKTVSPDFSFLSIVRGEIHWEHNGLINSRKYIEYHRYKRSLYESNGFVPWSNFIATYNEEDGFFDTREIESIISHRLKRWLYLV